MLVLSRKIGEEIIIDGDIRITVTAIADGRIKLGITAPKHVRVDRSEVAARVAEFAEPTIVGVSGTATRLRPRSRV